MNRISNQNSIYQNLYDRSGVYEGFSIIEDHSDEKEGIGQVVLSLVQTFPKNKRLNILDLAGGSGRIWTHIDVSDLIWVDLVDSSQNQIDKALFYTKNLSFVHPIQSDAVAYISRSAKNYDLILLNHFLPGLEEKTQNNVFEDCLKHLETGGMICIIQPQKDNPLSLLKQRLFYKLCQKIYTPSYYLNLNKNFKSYTKKHLLRIPQEKIIPLGYFLVGDNKIIDQNQQGFWDIVKDYFNDGFYEIEIYNQVLIYKK